MHPYADHASPFQATRNFFRALLVVLVMAASRADADSVTIAWTPNTSSDVTGFKVYYGPSSHVYTNALTSGNVSSLTIPGLLPGKNYFFAVASCGAAGAESAPSEEIAYTIPLPAVANNNTPAQTAIAPVAVVVQPAATDEPATALAQPSAAPKATAPINRTVSAKMTTSKAATSAHPRETVASFVAPVPAKSVKPEPTSRTGQIAAITKAKSTPHPTTGTLNRPYSAPATISPVSPTKHSVASAHSPESHNSVPTLASTVAAQAALFYSAVLQFEAPAGDRLNMTEQIALVAAIMRDVLPPGRKNMSGGLTPAEASEIGLWIISLHQQIARFDVNQDGKLDGVEQAALAATLEVDERLLPIFAPLMITLVPAR